MYPLVAEFLGMTGTDLKDAAFFFGGIAVLVLQYLNNRKITDVQHATNSMKDQLVAKTEAEALARGGVEERQRADVREEKANDGTIGSTIKKDVATILEKQEELPKEVVKEIKKDSPKG